jgi:hypothetical protein
MMTDGLVTGADFYGRMQIEGVERIEPPVLVKAERA